MDSENMKRVGLYLDKDLVNRGKVRFEEILDGYYDD